MKRLQIYFTASNTTSILCGQRNLVNDKLKRKTTLVQESNSLQKKVNGDKHAAEIQDPGKHEHSRANTSLLLVLFFPTTPALVSLSFSLISHHQLLRANIFIYLSGRLNAFP